MVLSIDCLRLHAFGPKRFLRNPLVTVASLTLTLPLANLHSAGRLSGKPSNVSVAYITQANEVNSHRFSTSNLVFGSSGTEWKRSPLLTWPSRKPSILYKRAINGHVMQSNGNEGFDGGKKEVVQKGLYQRVRLIFGMVHQKGEALLSAVTKISGTDKLSIEAKRNPTNKSVVEEQQNDIAKDSFAISFSDNFCTGFAYQKGQDLLALVRNERNRISSAGSWKCHSASSSLVPDYVGKILSVSAVSFTTAHAIGIALLRRRITLLDEASSALDPDSATGSAVNAIRAIITKIDDHGVVDVFSKHSRRAVALSVIALSRLQLAAAKWEERSEDLMYPATDSVQAFDFELLDELARYSIFASAAYGWKGGLALRGRIHFGDLRALLERTGVKEEDVVLAKFQSETHRPAFFVVRDVEKKRLIISIRGTWSAQDILTDLCATAVDLVEEGLKHPQRLREKDATIDEYKTRAHHGMVEGAKGVALESQEVVEQELTVNPDYKLVIVGHSLGGGTAAVLGSMWRRKFPDLLVYAYGAPCVGPEDAHPTKSKTIVSVVAEGDPFSTLSLGHVADVTASISKLCEDDDLRKEVMERAGGRLVNMSDENLKWCFDELVTLRGNFTGEKFFPPGRILYIRSSVWSKTAIIREVSTKMFQDLALHPFMFDLSRHIPSRYESILLKLRDHSKSSGRNVD